MMRVAIVDVGYNSLKMVKYRVESDGIIHSFGQLSFMAKLGEGLERAGYLGEEPIARTIEALRICNEVATLEGIKHVVLIGTSPIREAVNGEEFLQQVQSEAGMKMRVLSGNEEAFYGYVGAARSIGAANALFFDLGGGSLELVYAENFKIRSILSLPLGALKLSTQFASKDGMFTRRNRARMAKRITQLIPSRRELAIEGDAVLVGTGGTVRALARFEQDAMEYPIDKIHNFVLDSGSVQESSRGFFKVKPEVLDKIDAIGENRSETIAAGTLVVRLLMKRLGFRSLTVSTHGLREGILAEFLRKGRAPPGIANKEEVERLLVPIQASLVGNGSAELVDCLVRNGVVDERQRGVLLAAEKRGRSREFLEADADALFWILLSEDLPMSHEEHLFMALSLVRARRPRTANWLTRRYGALINSADLKAIKMMGACLRLMEIVDRAGARVKVSYSGGVRISVLESQSVFPTELARNAARGLSAAIKRPVIIVSGTRPQGRLAQSLKVEN